MAFGAERTARVVLRAAVGDYVANVGRASAATRKLGDDAIGASRKHKQSFTQLGAVALGAGVAIGAGIALAVKRFAEFDQQLSNVRSVSGATSDEMARLSAAALQAGADTKFSATDAAKAEAELAKVGISTSDILGGALLGSLNLAAAGNLDLADAATIAGQAMKIFKLNGADVGHIADVLAAGANKSAADVKDLGQALQQGGLVAAQTGLNLDQTVGVLSAFADNALMGSDAGTSFKTMLQRLTPQSQQAAGLMSDLGLSAYDAQGNFVGITKYAGQLQTALGRMSAEQRNSTLQILFGSDAIRAATVLYQLGADGVQTYVDAVNDQGAASRTAAIQMDNLAGDFEQLKGSIDTALIKTGSQGNEALRGLTQTATKAVNAFGDLPGPVQRVAFYLGAAASATLVAGGGLLILIPRIAATRTALSELGVTAGRTSTALRGLVAGGIVLGVASVADAFIDAGSAARVASPAVDELADSLDNIARGSKDAGALGEVFGKGMGPFRRNIDDSRTALDEFAKSAEGAFSGNWADRIGRVGSGRVATFTKQLQEIDAAMANMVQNGNIDGASKLYDQLMTSIEAANKAGAGIPVDEVAAKFTQYQAALDAAKSAQDQTAAGADALGGEINGVQVSAEDAAKAVDDLVEGLAKAGLVQLDARSAARDYQQAIADATKAVKDNGKTLDIHTEKGRANQAALDNQASSAIKAAQAEYDRVKAIRGSQPAEAAFRTTLLRSRDALVRTAERMGLSKAQAERYADSVLNIPAVKNTAVHLNGAATAISEAGRIAAAIARIPGRKTTDVVVRRIGADLGNLTKSARGGFISGPGTSTSDSIPALLSNGEYVIKAAAVARYGSAFFDRLNSMRFASGGAVGSPPVTVNVPQSAASRTVQFNGPLGVDELRIANRVLAALRQADALNPLY